MKYFRGDQGIRILYEHSPIILKLIAKKKLMQVSLILKCKICEALVLQSPNVERRTYIRFKIDLGFYSSGMKKMQMLA